MVRNGKSYSREQLAIVRWAAGLGAVTAEAFAQHMESTLASARARLSVAERAGLLSRKRVLVGEPALYTVTRAGLRAGALRGLEPCRVSPANAPHAIACAHAAAALERAYPDHRVIGERELRRDEREHGAPLASVWLGLRIDAGRPAVHDVDGEQSADRRARSDRSLHRPDLVLWPTGAQERLPVAVEVELTVKSPRRLLEICRAWARSPCVAGTLYLVPADVRRPLARAIERAHAGERIVCVEIDALARVDLSVDAPLASTVPSDA
jgi:hypothetical protein